MAKPLLISVQGPTASGKTKVAIELAQWLETEILSCDSRQFYKELKIGAAPPSMQELAQVKHHFIQNKSIEQDYNAGKFETEAVAFLASFFQTHPAIIMVGGSGLYANAVIHGFDELPELNETIRQSLLDEFNLKGIEFLQNELQQLDPDYFNIVDHKNPHRLIRALEIIQSTGKKMSQIRTNQLKQRPFRVLNFIMDWPRKELYERINKRVDLMMSQGLLEEVMSLKEYAHLQPLNTVGYKELFLHLNGELELSEAIELIKRNSRRYAKRQITWYKKQENINWVHPDKLDEIKNIILKEIKIQ